MSETPTVHIERATLDSSGEAVKRTLEALKWKEKVKQGSRVVIKPNGCHVKFLPGLVTTPSILGEVVRIFRTRASEVIVVESDLQRFNADQIFDSVPYRGEVEKAGGRCSNLTQERQIRVKIPRGQYWKERTMPESLVEHDLFVTMPVIKTHKLWHVSLCIKNQFGCVPESDRVKYQKFLPQVVGDFNSYHPAGLCIVDGIVGLEGDGPIAGIPKSMDLIVGGDNLVATDAVLSNIMGFKPEQSELIMNLHERGGGPIDLGKIRLSGLPLKEAINPYRPPSHDFISNMERLVRRHPKLANFVYRSWFFAIAKKTAWGVRGLYGYKSQYHEDVARSGLWEGYNWEELMQVYTPIA